MLLNTNILVLEERVGEQRRGNIFQMTIFFASFEKTKFEQSKDKNILKITDLILAKNRGPIFHEKCFIKKFKFSKKQKLVQKVCEKQNTINNLGKKVSQKSFIKKIQITNNSAFFKQIQKLEKKLEKTCTKSDVQRKL